MRASLALEANLAFRELGERSLFVARRRGWMSFSGPARRPFVRVRPEAGASRHKKARPRSSS